MDQFTLDEHKSFVDQYKRYCENEIGWNEFTWDKFKDWFNYHGFNSYYKIDLCKDYFNTFL